MKNLIKVFVVVLIATSAILLTNCAGVSQSAFESSVRSQVTLDQNNFVVVKRVEGEHSTKRIIGIGGLSDTYLKESAVANMYKNANLTGSQAIIDIHVIKSYTFILGPIFTEENYKAVGTLIEFTGPNKNAAKK